MEETKTYGIILTGRYESASPEELELMQNLFGEKAEHSFKLYFYWYNVIHELGHAIFLENNETSLLCPAEEEQLANDFATAYWNYYGEEQKLRELADFIGFALSRIPSPSSEDNYLTYAKQHWNSEEFSTFYGYGWFQYHSVQYALQNRKPLTETLQKMGISSPVPNPKVVLSYNLQKPNVSAKIICDAVRLLDLWNVMIPNISHQMADSPFCHCFKQNAK